MATNYDVANRFAMVLKYIDNSDNSDDIIAAPQQLPPYTNRIRDLRTRTMRVNFAEPRISVDSSYYNSGLTQSCNTFIYLAHGYSYSPRVASIVWNVYAQQVELWVNPKRYSDTTQRHVWAFIRAVRAAVNDVNSERMNTAPTHTNDSAPLS